MFEFHRTYLHKPTTFSRGSSCAYEEGGSTMTLYFDNC